MTLMAAEIAQAPDRLRVQRAALAQPLARLGAFLRAREVSLVVTIARGSSDCAALYLKHLVEILLGLPCASIGPSIASVFAVPLKLPGALAVTISQSGRGPDILALGEAARAGGAITLALINDEASPAAGAADWFLPLAAGPELAVAATKSMIAALAACASVVAAWVGDRALADALERLPDDLERAPRPPAALVADLTQIRSCFVIGRGSTLAIACETALKLKEATAIHAEAFSSAEVLHGPAALITAGFPVIAFVPRDRARSAMEETMARLAAMGARLIVVDEDGEGRADLATPRCGHPLVAPIAMIQSFYPVVEAVARARGRDPDAPPHLRKVTETT